MASFRGIATRSVDTIFSFYNVYFVILNYCPCWYLGQDLVLITPSYWSLLTCCFYGSTAVFKLHITVCFHCRYVKGHW